MSPRIKLIPIVTALPTINNTTQAFDTKSNYKTSITKRNNHLTTNGLPIGLLPKKPLPIISRPDHFQHWQIVSEDINTITTSKIDMLDMDHSILKHYNSNKFINVSDFTKILTQQSNDHYHGLWDVSPSFLIPYNPRSSGYPLLELSELKHSTYEKLRNLADILSREEVHIHPFVVRDYETKSSHDLIKIQKNAQAEIDLYCKVNNWNKRFSLENTIFIG